MNSLTVAFITSRKDSKVEWLLDSLRAQAGNEQISLIIVDFYADEPARRKELLLLLAAMGSNFPFTITTPKPTVWQGPHRLTKENWWAKSSSLNTAICLCRTEWIAFVDDRCVLAPGWLDGVRAAMAGNYAVCGAYEKWANLQVENGVATGGELLGADTRTPGLYPFDTLYGGHCALPLEWCLQVQGYNESLCDSLGLEDSMFGAVVRNSGLPIMYNSAMKIIEDRTPGQIDGALKRADKDVHLGQRAKSWAIVRALKDKTTSQNEFDIRNMRDRVLAGEPFPPPTGASIDWFDGQPLSEFL